MAASSSATPPPNNSDWLHLLAGSTSEFYLLLDLDGQILSSAGALAALLGCSDADLYQHSLLDFVPPEDHAALADFIRWAGMNGQDDGAELTDQKPAPQKRHKHRLVRPDGAGLEYLADSALALAGPYAD
ncbi:MAG: PAS domain-containing protein, partial [Leptospiraceae bacterium]|nr:PAS domain-containing protein [Leptospiraceae bacterium]